MQDIITSPEIKRLIEEFSRDEDVLEKGRKVRETFNMNGHLVNMTSPAKDMYNSFIKYIYLIKSGDYTKAHSHYNKTFYPFGKVDNKYKI